MRDPDQSSASSGPRVAKPLTPQWRRVLIVVGILLVIGGGAIFVIRGPMRAAQEPRDFLLIYSAARAWLQGGNPYELEDQHAAYVSSIGPNDTVRDASILDSLYPPTTFVMLAPISWMPLKAAHVAWIVINTLVALVGLLALLRVAGIDWLNPRGLLLLAVFLMMGPVHSAVTYGHLSLAVLAALACSYLALMHGRNLLAGVLIGAAAAAKPQLAGLFILAFFLLGYARVGAWAICCLLAALLIAALRMWLVGVDDWLLSWMHNVEEFQTTGHPGDADWTAPLRWQLVNITPLVYNIIESAWLAKALSIGVVIATLGTLTVIWRRESVVPSVLGLWCVMSVLTLLPVYHRYYDTCLLILPIVWCVRELRGPMHRWAVTGLSVVSIFVLPSSAILFYLRQTGKLPAPLIDTWFWRAVVEQHQNYLLLALLVVMLVGVARSVKVAQQRGISEADYYNRPNPSA